MKEPVIINKKICMLGSFKVGKTSLIRRFVKNEFDDKYLTTIGVKVSHKILQPFRNEASGRSEQLKMILWDIEHIDKFNEVIKNYFRGANGAIFVVDVTRSDSMKDADAILKAFFGINPKSALAFVGNKIDLIDPGQIAEEQFLQFEKKYQSFSMFTSAKTGENVEELFNRLGERVLK